mgnify:FL=1
MPVVGVEPTRVISTRDFEFSGGFSIWCHLVIFKVIWYPTLKRKNNSTSNEFLINLRFFVAFPLSSDFSIWNAKKEIGGIFRRNAGQNAPLLRHKTKGKSRMMNKFQARKFYRKMFANYPDVLTVEDATNLLGFKSQTGVIRRIHQNRIRYLKVGRNFMIPKEYLIDKQYDPENFAAFPAGFSGPFLLIAQSVLRTTFPVRSICLAIMLSSSCVIVAQFATR